MKTLDNFKCPSDSHPKHRRRAGNGNGAFRTPPPFPDGVLPEEKLLETVLQCFAHPLVGLCELLQGAAAASPRTLSHGAALRRPQLPPPLAAVFSTLCLVAVCVCMHVMFSFATRMQLKVQLACGTACNILGKAFFFPLFLSLFQAVESYHYLPYEGVVGKTTKTLVRRNGCGFITNHNCHPNDEREFQRAQD